MNIGPLFTHSLADRLHRALKGTSVLADPKARISVSTATLRDQLQMAGRAAPMKATSAAGTGIVAITDPTGNLFAMLDIEGAADGATLS